MPKLKIKDFSPDHLATICEIINRGNTVEIKKERENVVIVEIKRNAIIKSPIE